MMVTLRDGKKSFAKYVHRLVAEAFIPNKENKPTVNHIDGDKENNNVENLEYATHSENNQHAYDTGLTPRHKNRLTEEQVLQIRRESKVLTRREIANKYGLPKTKVDAVITRTTWKNI